MIEEQLVERFFTNIHRIADSLELISKHAHLMDKPWTVDQAAAYAHVKPKTIYHWKSQGKLKPLADGSKPLLFEASEVRRAVSRCR